MGYIGYSPGPPPPPGPLLSAVIPQKPPLMPISGTPIRSPDSVYLGSTLPIVFLSPDFSTPLTIIVPMCDNNTIEELGGGDQVEGRHYATAGGVQLVGPVQM